MMINLTVYYASPSSFESCVDRNNTQFWFWTSENRIITCHQHKIKWESWNVATIQDRDIAINCSSTHVGQIRVEPRLLSPSFTFSGMTGWDSRQRDIDRRQWSPFLISGFCRLATSSFSCPCLSVGRRSKWRDAGWKAQPQLPVCLSLCSRLPPYPGENYLGRVWWFLAMSPVS
jgi:hypothetical protein